MRQRPLPAARGKPPARQFCRWDPGSLSLPPPPAPSFRGPRGPVPDRISGEASLSDACGLSRDDARKHPIHPGSEAAGTHPKPAEAAPLGPGAKACWGCRIAFGQDHGFCGQRGALGSLSASSIFQLGDLGQGT